MKIDFKEAFLASFFYTQFLISLVYEKTNHYQWT